MSADRIPLFAPDFREQMEEGIRARAGKPKEPEAPSVKGDWFYDEEAKRAVNHDFNEEFASALNGGSFRARPFPNEANVRAKAAAMKQADVDAVAKIAADAQAAADAAAAKQAEEEAKARKDAERAERAAKQAAETAKIEARMREIAERRQKNKKKELSQPELRSKAARQLAKEGGT